MRGGLFSAALVASSGAAALPLNIINLPKLSKIPTLFPSLNLANLNTIFEIPKAFINPLPLSSFKTHTFTGLSLDEALRRAKQYGSGSSSSSSSSSSTNSNSNTNTNTNTNSNTNTNKEPTVTTAANDVKTAATCSNVRTRYEWESLGDADRQAFVNALKCMFSRPASGQFSQSKNRYEDFVALHQALTPNVHGNPKFLVWHRYFLWTFEDVMRSECGFTGTIPWFDETRYSGKFAQSSLFSNDWFGSIAVSGNCVTDGQFANLALNVGPGQGNTYHCLARNNDDSQTTNTNSQMVDACNSITNYADMEGCAEGGAHAWGHNGIGAVMQDVYASPGDPVFWLHHGFVDRNFRIWQNADASRTTTINGNDKNGNALTLDTIVNVYSIRPDVKIGDILDTRGTTLCYKYNY